jgi:hypothetical protein
MSIILLYMLTMLMLFIPPVMVVMASIFLCIEEIGPSHRELVVFTCGSMIPIVGWIFLVVFLKRNVI